MSSGRDRHIQPRPSRFPIARQGASHWNESLVRVMIVHLQSMIGLRLAVIEIESFADLDGDELRSVSSTWDLTAPP